MSKNTITFEYEYMDEYELRNKIRECEGKHVQQVVFSTYHDSITQICFSCMKIRSSIKIKKI